MSNSSTLLLITFANSLDRQNNGPDLDPNYLTLLVFLKEFFEKVNFEKMWGAVAQLVEHYKLGIKQTNK